jgi:ferredoxin-NADP reductase/predicted pyridoxine 5'-phosphate oxidase superfamily flavin-nucleotide-binding protein
MGHKFAEIAFTNNVKQVQSENKSRAGYSRMEQGFDANYLLGQSETEFILSRDSFYMASVSETDWPYVQHRGGPKGFLKIIDEKTIGFADYSGNRQYISTGNFRNNDRVSLFLMDYPSKSRLKILGRISAIDGDDTKAIALLNSAGFTGSIERGFIIHIEGYDWNCPKYITPRYTEDQIENMFAAVVKENQSLKEKLDQQEQKSSNDEVLGHGSLKLSISGIRQLTPRVRAFELKDPDGNQLPEVTAGSHIQVPVRLANGELVLRHYSICSNPNSRDVYEIAVLNEPKGKGGSKAIYQQYHLGQLLACTPPENYFPLQLPKHAAGAKAILIAGGIGITPIKAMAQTLQSMGTPFTLHYVGRSKQEMAFSERLGRLLGEDLILYSAIENQRIRIDEVLLNTGKTDVIYLCGPNRLMNAFIERAKILNIEPERLRFERFNIEVNADAKPISVTLKKSGKVIQVNSEESILDAMLAADIPAVFGCKTGECRTCAVKVLAGEPEHLDNALSTKEHEEQIMCPCVSRAKTSHLTLDV